MVQSVKSTALVSGAKLGNKKAKRTDTEGGIVTPGPYDPDFGPSLNPRFDGQYAWDLTNHNYLNYLFGLANMMGIAFMNGFGTTPGQTSSPDGTNPNKGRGNGNTGNNPNVLSGNPNGSMNGFPSMFSNPGLGFGNNSPFDFLGNPGQGSPFPFPPPYDPDLGPSLNPRFDGQYGWNLTNNNYLNGLFNGVNMFGQIINGFPVAGTAAAKNPEKKEDKKPEDKKPKTAKA